MSPKSIYERDARIRAATDLLGGATAGKLTIDGKEVRVRVAKKSGMLQGVGKHKKVRMCPHKLQPA